MASFWTTVYLREDTVQDTTRYDMSVFGAHIRAIDPYELVQDDKPRNTATNW